MALLSCSSIQAKTEQAANPPREQIDLSQWQLTWSDEFNYDNAELDKEWISQNGPTENEWVLGSRWRDNAVVKNGVLHLENRKESRGGQDWTSGNVWTKRTFGYGYFEARYKYAGAYGTNNSFWFWPKQGVPEGEKACEIDINEGHYPNIMNTNVHNWTDTYTLPNGRVTHDDNQLHHTLEGQPLHEFTLKRAIKTTKLRLRSSNPASIHIRDFSVFGGETNHALAKDVSITSSGTFNKLPSKHEYAVDGRDDTRWVSNKHASKWLQLEWPSERKIDRLSLLNGWLQEYGASKGLSRNLMADFEIEYHDGKQWQSIASYDAADEHNYAEDYHTYGLAWDEDYFRFYFDGELYHTMRNDVCFSETTLLFSLAILKADIAGPVTDAIDGTSMKVDWVRYYTPKANND